MIPALRPGILGPDCVFDSLLFTAHQFQNPVVLIFVEPKPMFSTEVEFQIEKPIIDGVASERGMAGWRCCAAGAAQQRGPTL